MTPSLVLVLALSVFAAGPAGAGVHLALSPGTLSVAPGDTFTLELRVPVAGSPFNGYEAVIEYDPAMLTFLPLSPTSLQQGPDMKNVCPTSPWHLFQAAGDSLFVSHVLLCPDTALTGPAHLYSLRFRASTAPAATTVRLRRIQFYDGGLFVNPAFTSDATVSWGVVLDAGAGPAPRTIRLAVRANPGRGEQWFDLASPREGPQSLQVFDAGGRAVRRLDAGRRPAGARAVHWDGRDEHGRAVPPGVYLVHFRAAGESARATIVRLP